MEKKDDLSENKKAKKKIIDNKGETKKAEKTKKEIADDKKETKKVENAEESKSKKKTKIIILILIIVITIVIAGVGGYYAYDKYQEDKPIETSWANTYYNFIKDSKDAEIDKERPESGVSRNIIKSDNGLATKKVENNSQIEFINVEGVEDPVMVVQYTENNAQYSDIYYIKNGEIANVYSLGPSTVQFLYNTKTQKYEWYECESNENFDIYNRLATFINPITPESVYTTSEELGNYTFELDEKISTTAEDGTEVAIPSKDTVFIETGVELNKIDYNENMKMSTLRNEIERDVPEYKTDEELATDTVKSEVDQKVAEVQNKQKEIEDIKATAEKKKAEEEAAKKAAEEAKRAEEEAKNGLKIGNYTLKYGTYKWRYDSTGKNSHMDTEMTYVIKPDGTFTYKKVWTDVKNNTYTDTASGKIQYYYSKGDDYDPTNAWIIKFPYENYKSTFDFKSINSSPDDYDVYDVVANNKFSSRQDAVTFTYQGN